VVEEGKVVTCQVIEVVPGRGLKTKIKGENRFGLVHITDLHDKARENPLKGFKSKQYIKAYVLSTQDTEKGEGAVVRLSLRPSRLAGKKLASEVASVEELAVGQVVKGFVKATTKKGCWVCLSHGVDVRVLIKDLSDKFVKDPETEFPVGKLVTGKVTMIADGKADMSLRASALHATKAQIVFNDLKDGLVVKGRIKNVQEYGVFVELLDSNMTGLCHISEVADTRVKTLSKYYNVGDLVRCVVLRLNQEKKSISLGMKASYFEGKKAEEEEEEGEEGEGDASSEDEGDDAMMEAVAAGDSDDDSDEEEGDDEEEEEESESEAGEAVPTLSIPTGKKVVEVVEESSDDDEEEESEEETEEVTTQKKTKKAAEAKRREREVALREEQMLDPNRTPETADDFQRLLVTSPNSSFLWIKYIAYHVELAEVGKARKVAEQALKQIDYRQEQEKLNIWMALLNLENMYGTEAAFQETTKRALAHNDQKTVYIEVAKLLAATEKHEVPTSLESTHTRGVPSWMNSS
jgi:rRNA biogenesis protein RRP5